jgi:hypothetical protein
MTTDSTLLENKTILDKYFQQEITFPAEHIDVVQGFFLKRGFEINAARSIAIVLLNQARIDKINVFQLLDKLKEVNENQLSQIITDILNAYRDNSSTLGFKQSEHVNTLESRDILV